MPTIATEPRQMGQELVTYFTDAVAVSEEIYNYPQPQTWLEFQNTGTRRLIITLAGQEITLAPGDFYTHTSETGVSSFTIRAQFGHQSFAVESKRPTPTSLKEQVDSLGTQLADVPNQSYITEKVSKSNLPTRTRSTRGKSKISTLKNADMSVKVYGQLNAIRPDMQNHISPTNRQTLTSAGKTFTIIQTDKDGNVATDTLTATGNMFPFDYITSEGEEKHFTRVRELLGTETWYEADWANVINGSKLFYMNISATDNAEVYCTHFKWAVSSNNSEFYNIFILNGRVHIRSPHSTVDAFKTWLASQKANNTPVQFYYYYADVPLSQYTHSDTNLKAVSDGDISIQISNTAMCEITYHEKLNNQISFSERSLDKLSLERADGVNDILDKVAHVSNIEHVGNGWMYCVYLCDKVNTIESASNLQTEVVLAKWNISKPHDVQYFKVCGVGDYINYFTLSTRAPYNPNLVFHDGYLRIYVDVHNGTEWFIGYFQFDTVNNVFLTDSANGNRRLFLVCNITYNGVTYDMKKSTIINLYSALGVTASGSVGQFICKHVLANGKYYIVFTGSSKALLLSTTNFKNYTLVSVFNSNQYMFANECAIEFIDNDRVIMLMRSEGGTYSTVYTISTNTWSALTRVSKVESRPQIVKNDKGIFGIYNREVQSEVLSPVDRKTLAIAKLNSSNEWEEILLNTYPFKVHYPSYAKVENRIYLSFTTGKKSVYDGSTNNGVNTIQVLPVVLE